MSSNIRQKELYTQRIDIIQRAQGRCEREGACGIAHDIETKSEDDRCSAIHGIYHPFTNTTRVLLTVHILSGVALALCQRCANRIKKG